MNVQSLSLPILWEIFRTRILRRKFVQDVSVLTIGNLVVAGLNFIQGILVARRLGPELYGLAALVMAFPSLIYTFFDARSYEASVRFLSEFESRGQREAVLAMCKLGYAVDLGISSLTLLIVIVTAPWAARTFVHDPGSSGLIMIYSAALIPRAMVGTSHAVLSTLGRFRFIAWIDVLSNIIQATLVVGFVLVGWQVAGVVWGNAIAAISAGLLYGCIVWMMIHRTWDGSPLQGKWKALRGSRRQIFRFLIYNDASTLLGLVLKQLDVLLLGYFRNQTEVGYYKLAKSLAGAVSYLVSPLQSVTYPKFARLWGSGDGEGLRRIVRRVALSVGAPLGLAVLCSTALVPFVLPLLVGDAFRPAIAAAQILLFDSAVWLAFFGCGPFTWREATLESGLRLAPG